VTALLFMEELRKIQAPMITQTERDQLNDTKRDENSLFSSIARAVKGSSVADLFAAKRSESETPEPIPQSTDIDNIQDNVMSSLTKTGRENLETVKAVEKKSEQLNSAASDFMNNAKLLAEKQNNGGWF
jgi:hypothetical protein